MVGQNTNRCARFTAARLRSLYPGSPCGRVAMIQFGKGRMAFRASGQIGIDEPVRFRMPLWLKSAEAGW